MGLLDHSNMLRRTLNQNFLVFWTGAGRHTLVESLCIQNLRQNNFKVPESVGKAFGPSYTSVRTAAFGGISRAVGVFKASWCLWPLAAEDQPNYSSVQRAAVATQRSVTKDVRSVISFSEYCSYVDAYAEMFNFEKCICEVEKRPPLCNITMKYYYSRELNAKCWKETCAEMQPEWNETTN